MTNSSDSHEEFSTRGEHDMEDVIDRDAKMLVVITEREHATILAALRYVARHSGLENTMEENIATNASQWDVMNTDEIHELGDRLNMSAIVAHDVRL
jgi:exopolysaccharide biosynthesis predicted pyruvyltransferase EpsI